MLIGHLYNIIEGPFQTLDIWDMYSMSRYRNYLNILNIFLYQIHMLQVFSPSLTFSVKNTKWKYWILKSSLSLYSFHIAHGFSVLKTPLISNLWRCSSWFSFEIIIFIFSIKFVIHFVLRVVYIEWSKGSNSWIASCSLSLLSYFDTFMKIMCWFMPSLSILNPYICLDY